MTLRKIAFRTYFLLLALLLLSAAWLLLVERQVRAATEIGLLDEEIKTARIETAKLNAKYISEVTNAGRSLVADGSLVREDAPTYVSRNDTPGIAALSVHRD